MLANAYAGGWMRPGPRHHFEHDGRSPTLREWATEFGMSYREICKARRAGITIADTYSNRPDVLPGLIAAAGTLHSTPNTRTDSLPDSAEREGPRPISSPT